MMDKKTNNKERLRIGEAADFLGVTVQTLRNWEKSGKLRAQRSLGGHRYYPRKDLRHFALDLPRLGWAWASSAQPPELQPEYYCERQDRFTSRLEKMGLLMTQEKNFDYKIASLLTAIAGEIGDNSFMHNLGNWPDVPGVFFAYDLGKKIIVLADRGQGVKKTLLRVRPEIETDVHALQIAFTEIISGRAPEKRGNGLKVVRRIVESNPISLKFCSGTGSADNLKNPDRMEFKTSSENVRGAYAVIKF